MIELILITVTVLYAWKYNLFGIRYKKDISSTDTAEEIEEYFEHTTPEERREDIEEYQERVIKEQQEIKEQVYEDSYPIAEVLRMLGMPPTIYPEYPARVSKHLLDTTAKQSILKRHLISLHPPVITPAESIYNNIPVSSQLPEFHIGDRIIYTKYDTWKWGEVWRIDTQKYYVKNYTGSGLTGTDTPFPGKWVIYRTDERYMRHA